MKSIFALFSFLLLLIPGILLAQGSVYAPLVDLSNAGQGNQVQTFEQYINFLYGMSIAVAALLAVIKIVIAGAKYMFSDVINTKGEALSDIQGAILGLLLILSAVIILELINPQLVNREITFDKLPERPAIPSQKAVEPTPEETNVEFDDAGSEALKNMKRGGCNWRSESKVGEVRVITLDMSGCPAGTESGPVFSAFSWECMNNGGKIKSDDLAAACTLQRTIVKSRYGQVIQQKGSWTKDVTFTTSAKVSGNDQAQLSNECINEKFGKVEITGAGTIGAKVTCNYPAVIAYSGDQSQYAVGDCNSRQPKGRIVESSVLKLGLGIDYWCVLD